MDAKKNGREEGAANSIQEPSQKETDSILRQPAQEGGSREINDEYFENLQKEAKEKAAKQRTMYRLEDFVFDRATDVYWCLKTLTPHTEKGVNASVPREHWEQEEVPAAGGRTRQVYIKPSSTIARIETKGAVVDGTTWWPGMPRIIKDVLVTPEGDAPFVGARTLNLYSTPTHFTQGDPAQAALWIEHVKSLWPQDYELLLDYFAHTVQHPGVKINYGLVLLGAPGIGKDLSLLPVKFAVGGHNSKDITPDNVASHYNDWVRSVLVVINEARATETEFKATDFYEKLKPYLAAPPNWLVSNPKYGKQTMVRNLVRIVITTNDPLALFVPEDDRRLYFAESQLEKNWAPSEYFGDLAAFYDGGGFAHVYAFLRERDISNFDPKRVPAATAAHRAATDSWAFDDPIVDAVDELGQPDVFFKSELLETDAASFDNKDAFLKILNSTQKAARAMRTLGYVARRPSKGQQWEFTSGSGKRFRSRVAYVKKEFAGDVETALYRRGREIAENGKAAKPKPQPDLKVIRGGDE